MVLEEEGFPFIFVSCDEKVKDYLESKCRLEREVIGSIKKLRSKKTWFIAWEEEEILKSIDHSTYFDQNCGEINFNPKED